MGRASGATALLAVAGLWMLCCVFVFGRFLGGEQPLDPRTHRARPDAAEIAARHLGSSGRLASGTEHGAGTRHELDAFTGHDAFAERRHGGGAVGAARTERESRRAKPYGGEDVSDAKGAMRVFAGHAAFDASRRSAEPPPGGSAGREMRDIDRGGGLGFSTERADVAKGERIANGATEAVAMESAPAFEAGELDDADDDDAALDDAKKNAADLGADPTVIGEQDISASLAALARRVAEREAEQETETMEQQVARLKNEALGRRGGALG